MLAIFKILGLGFKNLFKGLGFLGKFGGIIPVGIFIVSQFFIDLIRANLPYAFSNMAKTLFTAELKINELVHMAINNVPGYNIWSFIQILLSLYILYALVRFFSFLIVSVAGGQAIAGSYVISLLFVGVISISAIAVVDKSMGFIPIYDSVIFMFMNIDKVIGSIIGSSSVIVEPVIINVTNTTNSTIMGFNLFFGRKHI